METQQIATDAFMALFARHTEEMRILKRSLKDALPGVLMVTRDKGRPVYYRVICDKGTQIRKRITGKEQLVYRLAHQKYRAELLRRKARNNILFARAARGLLPEDPQSVIAALPKGYDGLDYSRIIDPDVNRRAWPNPSRDMEVEPERARLRVKDMTPEEWASAPYCENTKELGNKTHRSRRGILCRSKGEAMLLDVADDMGLRYRYDSVVLIEGIPVSPDLIIARPDGALIFVEHHGWIDEDCGDSGFLSKLWTYSRVNILQGRNLLITFDKPDGSCDTELIRRQLENMLGQVR